jgi:hypothetical protein
LNDDNILFIRKGDHKKLFTHFKLFYINRIDSVNQLKKTAAETSIVSTSVTQKPHISSKSSKLAEQKRQKMMGKNAKVMEILLQPTNHSWREEQQ